MCGITRKTHSHKLSLNGDNKDGNMNRTGKTVGDRCDPAASVIIKLGGVRKLARELGIDPSALSKWQQRRKGTGGLIPARYHWTLISVARAKGIKLTADELIGINGRQ